MHGLHSAATLARARDYHEKAIEVATLSNRLVWLSAEIPKLTANAQRAPGTALAGQQLTKLLFMNLAALTGATQPTIR